MKIAITGANGYIGASLVKKCLDFGHSVVAVDLANEYIDKRAEYINADIFNDENLYQKFGSPDVLIHLAWKNGFIHNAPSHLEDLYAHYKFVTDMIDNNIKNVSVLGTMHEVGYHVGAIDENTPCNPLSLYGISKNALRQSLMYYVSNKEVNFHWLRGFYIIGDDMRSNSIFGKIMRKAKAGEKTFPLNSGKIKYDFISLDDLCTQILATSVQGEVNGIINMCSGNPVPLGDRVEQFISDNNLDISLEYNVFPDRPYDSPIIYGDASKIKAIIDKSNNNLSICNIDG